MARGTVTDTRAPGPVPWWVNVLDLATLGLVVVALSLLFWTGPRVSLGFAVVSVRSPWRILAWAAGVGALRHLLFLRAPSPLRLWAAALASVQSTSSPGALSPGRWRADTLGLVRSPAARSVATIFVLSRCAVLLAGYLAVVAIGYPADRERPRLADNGLANLMAKWDAEWYLNIATGGYQWDGDIRHQMRIAFFPGYPVASRMAGWVIGNTATGAALVALASFLWALAYLFRLAREDLGADEAEAAVLFLAFSPFAVFYSAIYTESMYLLGAVGAFYHVRRTEWTKASAWGLLVGLTRPNGFLLSAALLTAAVERALRARREGQFDARARAGLWTGGIVASMPVIGAGLYSTFVYSLTGNPLMWLRMHSMWGRGQVGAWDLLVTHYGWIRQMGFSGYVAALPIDVINSGAAVLALAAIWPVARRFSLAYAVFIAANVAVPLLSGTTLSLGRLTCTLFPIFLWLAAVVPARRRAAWIAGFATLQGFTAVMFYTWRRLY
jgi:hypothetical protein